MGLFDEDDREEYNYTKGYEAGYAAAKADLTKHGHWVHGKELSRDYIGNVCVSIHYDKWWCSECNYPVEGQPLWTYCPSCGAKMDEKE